jgi:HAE1 family hydrophobic/amphiphilic exporter-1
VIRRFVDHPVATWMLFAALVIMGLYALPRLEIEAMPDTELPSLSVTTTWIGASPSAVLRSLTLPVEAAARKVYGVEGITSSSRPGLSQVTVEFRRDVNLEFAQLELAEQLGGVRADLPATASQPRVVPEVPEEFRTDDFMTVSLISDLSANDLRDKAETWLLPRLLAVPGVADVELQGGALPLVKVLLDFELMERYAVHADEVYAAIDVLDDILPAGGVRRRGLEIAVSVQDSVTARMVLDTVVATRGGQPIALWRLAELAPSYDDPTHFVRINGRNVIQASIAKRSGTNAISVSRDVRAALPRIRADMPFPVDFEIDTDNGEELRGKVRELVNRSLAILVLLFLLLAAALRRVRFTAIVTGSILLAIVICLSLFYFFGVSVNFITISGLTVCFGMLIDNSILVLDAIHRRVVGRRGDVRDVLVAGTREVAFPIMATTLTTVVAFLSFMYLSDRLAVYYQPLAVSVGIAMSASIFVAFAWIPVALRPLAARELARARAPVPEREGWPLLWRWAATAAVLTLLALAAFAVFRDRAAVARLLPWFAGALGLMTVTGVFAAYVRRITAFHLRRWWYPLLLLAGAVYGGYHLYRHEVAHGGFWQQQDAETLVLYLERPVGTDVLLASETMKQFEADLEPVPDGVTVKTTSWDNRAFMRIEFEEPMLRTEYPELYRNRLILRAEELGGMFIWINGFGDPYLKGGGGGGMSNSLLRLTGYNSRELEGLSAGVMERLARSRRVRNVRLTGGDRFDRSDTGETLIVIDRAALAQHHLTVQEVVGYLRRLLGIEFPWHMILEGRDQRLQLAFADADNLQYDQIVGHTMATLAGRRVRLADLVSLQQRPVVNSINRKNQQYAVQINWEYVGTDRMRQHYLQEIIAGVDLPYGYTAEDVSGEQLSAAEEQQMNTMLWLTAVFVFITMAALFESLTLPLLILLALPMALCGVMAVFWLTGSQFDSSARIGLVLLFGIVVNNAILLVNRFRLQLRERLAGDHPWGGLLPDTPRLGGGDLWRLPAATRRELLHEAIIGGTAIQLRSILLTTGTTIVGLLPLLVRMDDAQGKDIWENLALSSIGGLASSTVLIVAAMPVLYWVFCRCGWGLAALRDRLLRRAPAAAAPAQAPDGGSGA